MTAPNLFLIGAPKCGTTSLAIWLAQHNQVFMCAPKEPFFFCKDINAHRAASTWAEYMSLFDEAKGAPIVGEASTSYIRSRVAVPNILERLPGSRFIVCLRNPVDMIASVHGQMLRGVRENIVDLGDALELESARRLGEHLPPGTHEPSDLLYTETCALGSQLERLYKLVDRAQIHLVFLDDMSANSQQTWLEVQAFLGLNDDGRASFTVENKRALPRSVSASRILRKIHQAKNQVMPGRSLGVGAALGRILERPPTVQENVMSVELRADLVKHFSGEIDKLEALTGRDLSCWRKVAV